MRQITKWIKKQLVTSKALYFDHVGVCLAVLLFGWLFVLLSEKIGLFDPIKAAFDDFFLTDVYYEMLHSASPDEDEDIVIIDMTSLTTRDDISKVITEIKTCAPKVLCIDLLFERQSFDLTDDIALINSLQMGDCQQVLPCKLRAYDKDDGVFKDCLYSFVYKYDEHNILKWGYSNYHQVRLGGCSRETSIYQQLGDSVVYSLPYIVACLFQDRKFQKEDVNERLIMYEDVDFRTIKSDCVRQNADKLKGKIIILGTIAEEADMHFTPLGKMPGVKVVAYSIRTYLKGGEIKWLGNSYSLLIAVLLWIIAAWLDYRIEQRHPIMFAVLAKICNFFIGAGLVWLSFELYCRYNCNINLLYPLLGLAIVEDVREMYSGVIKWLQEKTGWIVLKKSLYAKKE